MCPRTGGDSPVSRVPAPEALVCALQQKAGLSRAGLGASLRVRGPLVAIVVTFRCHILKSTCEVCAAPPGLEQGCVCPRWGLLCLLLEGGVKGREAHGVHRRGPRGTPTPGEPLWCF